MKIFFAALLCAVCILSLFVGAADLSALNDGLAADIIINMRAPRTLTAALIGAMLGVSGAVYQLVLRNPLADSFTTGAASSCALGAVLSIALGVSSFFVPVFAFIGGIIGLFTVYRLSSVKGYISPVTMILAGVVLNIVASSIIGFVKFYYEDSLTSIVFWLMGGIYFADYAKAALLTAALGICFFILYGRSRQLDMLMLDDVSAKTSGVDVRRERAVSFTLATAMVAFAVSFTGMIGFVGLIVPHVVRSFFGSRMKGGLYYSAVLGAVLLVVSDMVSRVIIPGGAELPVGILTAVFGGVFFLYILHSRKGRMWND